MREILFKAKRMDNGEWVEGYYVRRAMRLVDSHGCLCPTYSHRIYRTDEGKQSFYAVDPETVCQFTGLTDKNGEKIFEGDKIEFNLYGMRCSGNVRIVDGNACVCIGNAAPFLDDVVKKCEAVKTGNIHDKEV